MVQRSVLFLGNSILTFSDTVPEEAVPELTRAELRRLAPHVVWQLECAGLFYADNMVARAREAVERTRPDIVLFWPGTYQFAVHHSVVRRLRRSHPLVGVVLQWLISPLDRLHRAGGRLRRLRDWLLRGPHLIGRSLFGAEASVRAPEAQSLAIGTLEALHDSGAVPVCILPIHYRRARTERARSEIDAFNAALRDNCAAGGVVCVDLEERLTEADRGSLQASDGVHYQLPVRRLQAAIAVEQILVALGIEPAEPPARRDPFSDQRSAIVSADPPRPSGDVS